MVNALANIVVDIMLSIKNMMNQNPMAFVDNKHYNILQYPSVIASLDSWILQSLQSKVTQEW